MDPSTFELLSRLIDGDLDAGEAERLELRLAEEPGLAAELAALRALQGQVGEVAERMRPPSDLDAVVLPLQRGVAPPPRRLPPAVRWIGMAAGLALAVTVAVEVARRPPQTTHPGALTVATPAPPPKPSEFFQLKPLPTASAPEGEEPLGAADRLLASPPAEVPLPEPAPLDVRGPLTEEEANGRAGKVGQAAAQPPAAAESDRAAERRQRTAASNEAAAEAKSAAASVAAAPATDLSDESSAGAAAGRFEAKKQHVAQPRLVLFAADGVEVGELPLPVSAVGWPHTLEVTVAGGLIVSVEAERQGAVDGDELAFIREAVTGRSVPSLANGRYRATVEASTDLHHPQ